LETHTHTLLGRGDLAHLGGKLLGITVAEDRGVLGHRVTESHVVRPVAEEGAKDALVGLAHEVRERRAEVLGRGHEMVVRDDREQMMDLVRANVVDHVVDTVAVRAIDRRQVALMHAHETNRSVTMNLIACVRA